jgi:hypothetical protein
MKVYHGSFVAIDEIDLNCCEVGKDFGKGFYVTKLHEQAKIWATRKGKEKRTESVVTEFEFDEDICRVMKLKTLSFDDYNDNWLDFVVRNRKNFKEQQTHDYDIVEGPVADDRINRQIDEYIDGAISKEQFLNDLIYYPSHQICFCTLQSLQALSLSKGRIDSAMYHIDSDVILALMKDNGMTALEAADIYYTSKTYIELTNETTNLYRKQWTEIYGMLKIELKL